MDQIEELKHLLFIAKHPKNRKFIGETLDNAMKQLQQNEVIARCLAISQRREKQREQRRKRRLAMRSARRCRRVKARKCCPFLHLLSLFLK